MWSDDEDLERRVDAFLENIAKKHPDRPLPSRSSARIVVRRALEQKLEEDGDTLPNFVKTRRLI